MPNTLFMYNQTLEPTIKGLQKFQHQLRRDQETFCLKKLSILIPTRLTIFHGYRPFYFLNFFRPTLILERSSTQVYYFFFQKFKSCVYICTHIQWHFLKKDIQIEPKPNRFRERDLRNLANVYNFFKDNYNMLLILQFEPFHP